MSDAWLVGRARELRAAVQSTTRAEQLGIVAELDVLLEEAQTRGEPLMVADLLRSAAMARLSTPGLSPQAEPLLDELLAHTRKNGLPVLRAGAHALQGKRMILAEKEDEALTEIARALAILDDLPTPATPFETRVFNRSLVTALVDCWQGLNELGLYETAEEVSARSHRAMRESAGPHEITLQMFNLIEMLLAWALRLERIKHTNQAREKFAVAASVAAAVEAPFTESLFRLREAPAIEQIGLIAAAVAFNDPGRSHIERLKRLFTQRSGAQEQVLVAIALARCLECDGQGEAARDVLLTARREADEANTPVAARLNIDRELARFELAANPGLPEAVTAYTLALERELWDMRESRAAALQTRRNHERLSAEHGAIAAQAAQALQDPLTGLPNRRALDERLRALASDENMQPLSVALVDLDGFKGVNDNQSHAEGDDVLRVIASTLRDTLRGNDVVARYGGDEFVVLLPGAPAASAAAAMNRTVAAVSELPGHLSRGVTLSVGLVSMAPSEHPESVLTRADAAMYQAKRSGGNRVYAATQDSPDAS
ncbi:GGDEF domain-containing protein [Haloechinothrix salitolerans]|uniref:Diguanylate cyclase n=1 Tax=Haloechinothrix salitolerans TaxID=926830 RepID=A0ABW2BWD4_9PSEU